MSTIDSVTIRRFKQLREITVPLKDTTILIGANNSGKSSILQSIHFAVSIAQTAKLVGEGVSWARDAFEVSFNPTQLIYSPIADVMALAFGGSLQEPRTERVEVDIQTAAGDRCVVGLRRGRNRNIAVAIEGRVLGEKLMDRVNPFSVYAPGLAGVPKDERFMSPGAVRRIVARGDANLVLRNVLLMLSQRAADWAVFLDDMRTLFKGIEIAVDFDAETDETIEVTFQLPGGPRLPIDAAGTSILQASQIFAYISLFHPRVLILDEPDSHLHPNNQRALCDLVHRVATSRNFQAIISTHSRHVVDVMKNRGGLIWLNKGAIVPEADRNTTSLLLDLGALDSADYFADGTLKCIVATEDSDTAPLKALIGSNGFVDEETEIVSYSGCAKIDAAKVLGRFIADKAAHLKLIVHRDRDYMAAAVATKFSQALQQVGIAPLLTDGNDIESYFINADHLNALNPAVTVARIQAIIDQATTDTRQESIAALVNLRTTEAFAARRDGGGNVDHGAISVQAHNDYDAAPAAYRRGTIVIGRVIAGLQAELHANPRVWEASVHLVIPTLQAVSAQIWPPAPVAAQVQAAAPPNAAALGGGGAAPAPVP